MPSNYQFNSLYVKSAMLLGLSSKRQIQRNKDRNQTQSISHDADVVRHPILSKTPTPYNAGELRKSDETL